MANVKNYILKHRYSENVFELFSKRGGKKINLFMSWSVVEVQSQSAK